MQRSQALGHETADTCAGDAKWLCVTAWQGWELGKVRQATHWKNARECSLILMRRFMMFHTLFYPFRKIVHDRLYI